MKEEKYEETYEVPKVFWNWEKISDWEKRIKNYEPEVKEFYRFMIPKFQELKEIHSSGGWNLLEQRDGIKVETK